MDENERMLVQTMSAVSHLIEFLDTGEPVDLATAFAMLKTPDMTKWLEFNSVMLPLRRDRKSLLKRLAESNSVE